FFFSSRRRHTRFSRDWSSDVCSSDLAIAQRIRYLELGRKLDQITALHLEQLRHVQAGPGIGSPVMPMIGLTIALLAALPPLCRRSEERRVGKEDTSRWSSYRWTLT